MFYEITTVKARLMRNALVRLFVSAGNSIAASKPTTSITTSNSISVKPRRVGVRRFIFS